MFKCSNECPKGHGNICCHHCQHKETCDEVCPMQPEKDKENYCGDSIQVEGDADQAAVVEFQNSTALMLQSIAQIVTAKKLLEEQEKSMKEKLQAAMEANGIKSFNNDVIKLTYVSATTTSSIDSAKLKKKYPQIAEECSKTSNKSAYVKIEVK